MHCHRFLKTLAIIVGLTSPSTLFAQPMAYDDGSGAGIVQAQVPQGAAVGWEQQVVSEDAAQGFTAKISGGDGAGLITLDPSGECSLQMSGDIILNLTSAPGWDGDTAIKNQFR